MDGYRWMDGWMMDINRWMDGLMDIDRWMDIDG